MTWRSSFTTGQTSMTNPKEDSNEPSCDHELDVKKDMSFIKVPTSTKSQLREDGMGWEYLHNQ